MSAQSPRPGDRPVGRRGTTETLAFKMVALIVVATLAALLWQLTVPRVVALVGGHEVGSHTVEAVVERCGDPGDCEIRFIEPRGTQRVLPLTQPGMFEVAQGDRLTVRVDPSGQAALDGWQARLDAALLLVLAITMTVFGVGWWRRVLEHHDNRDPVYDGVPGGANDVGLRPRGRGTGP